MTTGDPPPAHPVAPGATDHGDGRVTFALYAPNKTSVHLIGNFNSWDRQADPLQPDESGLWHIEKRLAPGSHTYQFLVDNDLIICDPYARYLAEGAEQDPPRAIVSVGDNPFQWKHDDWARPAFSDLIVYELNISDFSPANTFVGVIHRLDHLARLGINAIELMPVFEYTGRNTWGYNPTYPFTAEKSYGTPDELRTLIDEAHGRGIAVILDIVLAHTAHNHPFNQLYAYEDSPWYGTGLGEENQFGFPTFDYSKPAAQAYAHQVQSYWLTEFRVDGFRYDYLHGVGFRGPLGLPHLVKTAHEACPDVYLIGEYSPEDPGAVNASGLDGCWRVAISYALKAALMEREYNGVPWDDLGALVSLFNAMEHGYSRYSLGVNFMESHDEERVIRLCREAGLDDNGARFKSALGASLLFTLPGEVMLYNGQEWGEDTARTLEKNPIHWDRLETPGGKGLFEHHCRLCGLRREHGALRAEGYALDALYPAQKSIVYHRWDDGGDEVVVAANFSSADQSVGVPFPRSGRWRDVMTDAVIEVDVRYDVQLGPSSAAIFVHA